MNRLSMLLFVLLSGAVLRAGAQESDPINESLKLVPDTKLAKVFMDPDADFKRYTKFAILEPYVAFRKHWERDHRDVRTSDMDRIKRGLANLFLEEFQTAIEADGYQLVEGAGEDVLVLRPALIDLDVAAPDVRSAGRTTNYVANAGAVTLYVEVLDSSTGAVLARVIDRKAARDTVTFQIANSVYNSAEARKIIKYWAETLRNGFKELHNRP